MLTEVDHEDTTQGGTSWCCSATSSIRPNYGRSHRCAEGEGEDEANREEGKVLDQFMRRSRSGYRRRADVDPALC